MKYKIYALLCSLLLLIPFTGCGSSSEITQFKENLEDFCNKISELDTSINNIDARDENAASDALDYLDQLDAAFREFSETDFPKAFDYLEKLADEASDYMSTAVKSYHDAYADGDYDEKLADYAKENSSRALKRIQAIIDLLRNEE